MHILKRHDYPTAYPIPALNGTYLFQYGGQNMMLYEFKHGIEPEVNERSAREMGKAIGRLSIVEGWESLTWKQNTLDPENTYTLIRKFPIGTNPKPDLFKAIRFYAEELYQLNFDGLPKGIIHGDTFPNNTIFTEDHQLVALIDVEEAAIDYLMLDVGMGINGFCYLNNQLDMHLLRIFLDAYQCVRPLEAKEKEMLPAFIQLAAFGMLCWHMRYHLVDMPNEVQEYRVRELLARIRHIGTHQQLKELIYSTLY